MSERPRARRRPEPVRRVRHRAHRDRLCAVLVALLAVTIAPPDPARAAAPACGPEGGPPPTQTPWPLRRLEPAAAWRLTRGGGVTVAVIDSGVSATHPVLAGKVRPGRDFGLPDRSGQCDEVGHGTLIAGVIAGHDNGPFTGIAPAARILPVRVLRDSERTFDENLPRRIAEAIRWSVDEGAQVINLSLVTEPTPALASAVEYALQRRVVLVAAAGNQAEQQPNQPAYPARYPGVIAVAGIDENGAHVGSSVSGDYVDVAAPGLNIEGPAPRGDGYWTAAEGGTSYATAYVSGVAALVRAYHPELSAYGVADRIVRTADHPPEGRNAEVGHGVVNPYRAVATLLGTRTVPPSGALRPAPPVDDPLRRERVIAIWAAVGAASLALSMLLVGPVLRLGRRRRWRPGREASGW